MLSYQTHTHKSVHKFYICFKSVSTLHKQRGQQNINLQQFSVDCREIMGAVVGGPKLGPEAERMQE